MTRKRFQFNLTEYLIMEAVMIDFVAVSPCNDVDAAVVNSSVAVLNALVSGMNAENMQCAALGHSMAYSEEAFRYAVQDFYASLHGYVEELPAPSPDRVPDNGEGCHE